MRELSVVTDGNFPVRGFGLPGIPDPSNVDRSKFVSESALDTALAAKVPAKDRPYLTMNDKVFAARYTVAGFEPIPSAEAEEVEPEPEPEPEPEAPAE